MENQILDYDQVQDILSKLVENGKIIKQENLGMTKYGLPIEHYTFGNGEKEIVITGSTHGSEIVSTDFVLQLMTELQKSDGAFKNIDLSNYTFHFIPVLNPEGYIITTSAVRKLIPRNMSKEEATEICHQYYLAYRQDDIDASARRKEGLEPDRESIKHHQKFFEGIDWTCIPDKYSALKEHVRQIYEKYPDLPKNTLHTWSSNGDGVDLQSNNKYNPKIQDILEGKKIYADSLRYSNLDVTHPGPISVPFDQEIGFEESNEIQALRTLLESLKNKGTLAAYFNYHSTGGLVYQRPAEPPANLGIDSDSILDKTIRNYISAKLYAKGTYKKKNGEEHGSEYDIKTGKDRATSSNDILRLLYPSDLLIELSRDGGNPIAPYGDENNYRHIIKSNLRAFKCFLHNNDLISQIAQDVHTAFKESIKNGVSDDIVPEIYSMINDAVERFFESPILDIEESKSFLEKLLTQKNIPDAIDEDMMELCTVIPEIKNLIEFKHTNPNYDSNVWGHTLSVLRNLNTDDLELNMAGLLHDIGKPLSYGDNMEPNHLHRHPEISSDIAREILTKLNFDSGFIERVCYLIRTHDTIIDPNNLDNSVDMVQKRLQLQYADAKAHTPEQSQKRIEFLDNIKQKLETSLEVEEK